jgi:hypothetical protein
MQAIRSGAPDAQADFSRRLAPGLAAPHARD